SLIVFILECCGNGRWYGLSHDSKHFFYFLFASILIGYQIYVSYVINSHVRQLEESVRSLAHLNNYNPHLDTSISSKNDVNTYLVTNEKREALFDRITLTDPNEVVFAESAQNAVI